MQERISEPGAGQSDNELGLPQIQARRVTGVRQLKRSLRALSLASVCALPGGSLLGCSHSADDSMPAAGGHTNSAGGSSSPGGDSNQSPGVGGAPDHSPALGGSSGETPGAAGAGPISTAGGATTGAGGAAIGNQAGAHNVGGSASSAGSSSAGGTGGRNANGGAGGRSAAGGAGNGTDKITVWLAGDSTMADGGNPCPVGWGKQFQAHFNANAKVVNSAVGGTTVRSWLYSLTNTLAADGECGLSSPNPQAHWTAMVNGMKAGDYLFIQFGINDSTGPACPKHVSVNTFKTLFGMMAQAAKDKGAQPVFLTAVSSISCNGAVAQGTRGGFATATKDAAKQFNVPVIDLEQLSVARYTALGFCPSTDSAPTYSANTPIGNFFCSDHTHFEAAGAKEIANVVAKAIADQGLGLASYLVP